MRKNGEREREIESVCVCVWIRESERESERERDFNAIATWQCDLNSAKNDLSWNEALNLFGEARGI